MGVFSENAIIGASAAAGGDGYSIDKSCRFDRASSSKLTKTAWTSSAANRRKWTYSVWFKLGTNFGTARDFFYCGGHDECMLSTADTLDWGTENYGGRYITTQVFRDPNAWYHAVFRMDTTDGTPADRMQLFINGVRIPDANFGTSTDPTLNHQTKLGDGSSDFGIGVRHSTYYWDGYFSEIHFIDGTALNADQFGEFGDYGEWKPIEYTGSHGTAGFYLDFADSGNLGDDESGNTTDLVETNLAASDQMTDTPTNNFATLNPLAIVHPGLHEPEFKEGNLFIVGPANGHHQGGTNGTLYTSNKIYYEFYLKKLASHSIHWGIAPDDYNPSSLTANNAANLRPGKTDSGIIAHGVSTDIDYANTWYDGSSTVSTSGYPVSTQGQIVSVAFDPVTGKYWFARNNVWQGGGNPATGTSPIATLTNLNHTWTANVSAYGPNQEYIVNFGQDGTFAGNVAAGGYSDDNDYGNFKYPVPAGFLSLCSKNQTDCSVTPSENFQTILWNGTGSSNPITGVGFAPDFTWIKRRNATQSHCLYDTVRGATKQLLSNSTYLEETETTGLTAFGADGFTLSTHGAMNGSGGTYVGWNWKANGSGSSNEDGSINTTSTSANVAAGFSISTYTGTGSNATVGHGLSVAPNFIVIKRRDSTSDWVAGSVQSIASMDFTDYINLNETAAASDNNTIWNDTAPTASVFSIGTDASRNASSGTYVAYCWHSVEGYSKIGSYKGNNNAVGTFVYCGFRPAYVIKKNIGTGSTTWQISDSARDTYNVHTAWDLSANSSGAESSLANIDFLSNGFKLRKTGSDINNGNFLFLAFAETPFKNANAR